MLSTFTVSNTLDDGSAGTLRWAIGAANRSAGPDTIDFDRSVFDAQRTITLSQGQLELTDSDTTTIAGPGSNLLTISGNDSSRVLLVSAGAQAELAGLTITGGSTFGDGGGILNLGSLTLTDVSVLGYAAAAVPTSKTLFEYNIPSPGSASIQNAFGPDGRLWYAGTLGNHIGAFDLATHEVELFAIPTPDSRPRAVTVSPDGNIWFTENRSNQIGKLDPRTGVIIEYATPTSDSGPRGITVGPDGNIWFAESRGNRIGRLVPATGVITEFVTPTALSRPTMITVGPDGNLWFTEVDGNKIGRINPDTGEITEFAVPTAGSGPFGITSGPDGNIWFTEIVASRIGVLELDTGTIIEYATPTSDSRPFGIAVGPDGNLWLTEYDGKQIGLLDPLTRTFVELSLPPGRFPGAITAGPDGNLWYTDDTGHVGVVVLSSPPAESTTQVVVSGNPQAGQPVTFTATVAPEAGFGLPTGTVTFTVAGVVRGSVPVVNGQASLTVSDLSIGSFQVVASYEGDSGNNRFAASQATGVLEFRRATISIRTNSDKLVDSEPIQLIAQVSGSGDPEPTGTVTFLIDGVSQTPIPLVAGRASFSTRLENGSHEITAIYSGDLAYVPGQSTIDVPVGRAFPGTGTRPIALPIRNDLATGSLTEGSKAFYTLDAAGDVLFKANLDVPPGSRARLILYDATGSEMVRSDGASPNDLDPAITAHLGAGTFYLEVVGLAGSGPFALRTSQSKATLPEQPVAMDSSILGVRGAFARFQDPEGSFSDFASLASNGDLIITYSIDIRHRTLLASYDGRGASSLLVGDFNNDRFSDLAVGTSEGVEVFLHRGIRGQFSDFAEPTLYKTTSPVTSLVAGPFLGEGAIDIAVGTYSGVEVLKGRGDGTLDFTRTLSYLPGTYVTALVAGDFQAGNPHLDLGVGTADGFQVLASQSDGGFDPVPTNYLSGRLIHAVVAADFNADGALDLALGTADGGEVLLGSNQGTFAAERSFLPGLAVTSLATGFFFYGDQQPDLAALSSRGVDVFPNSRASGAGFDAPYTYLAGENITSLTLGTKLGVHGETLDGIGATTPDGGLRVLPNTFNEIVDYGYSYFAAQAESTVIGDFNGDGNQDLAVGTPHGLEIVLGNGNGTFMDPVTYTAGRGVRKIVAEDFDGDGHPDLAVGLRESKGQGSYLTTVEIVQLLMNRGDGSFVETFNTGELGLGELLGLSAADYNGDGKPDLSTSNFGGRLLFLNIGEGDLFSRNFVFLNNVVDLPTADLNGDGWLDSVRTVHEGIQVVLGNGDGTFTPLSQGGDGSYVVNGVPVPGIYFHGYFTWSTLMADFDRDGKIDLAVGTQFSGIFVMKGVGDGTFVSRTRLEGENYYPTLSAGDFQGDGRLSLATSDGFIYPGNGDGTFGARIQFGSPLGATFTGFGTPVIGDLNNDGRLDLVTANFRGVHAYLNNGRLTNSDLTFAYTKAYPVPTAIKALVTGDFNGDGQPDTASTDGDGLVVVPGMGDGTLGTTQRKYLAGLTITGLAADDFAADGTSDLLAATSHGVFVLTGGGDVTVGPTIPYLPGRPILAVATADFNEDDFPDLAAIATDGSIELLLNKNDGSGGLRTPITVATVQGVASLVAADLNHDGFADLVMGTSEGIEIWLGHGNATFTQGPRELAGLSISMLVTGDFDGDGRTDLAASTPEGAVVLSGTGRGTFSSAITVLQNGLITSLAAGDFNGDGRSDLAVATPDGVMVLRGHSDGTFDAPTSYLPGVNVTALLVSDLNGDNRGDLITGQQAGIVQVQSGLGDGTFGRPPVYGSGQDVSVVASGEFNGDGRPDLVVGSYSSVQVLAGNGDGTFATSVPVLVGRTIHATAPGDFNGDGRLDLAAGTDDGLAVLLGKGDGSFAAPAVYLPGQTIYTMVAGDFQMLGRTDLAVGTRSGNLYVLPNQGDGTFGTLLIEPLGYAIQSLVADDFNGDQSFDLAAGTAGGIKVLLGNGDGQFAAHAFLPTSSAPGDSVTTLLAGDFTGDGALDLVAGNFNGGVLFLPGARDGSFRPAQILPGFLTFNASSLAAGDFNVDGDLDLAVGSSSGVQLLVGSGTGTFTSLAQSLSQVNVSSLAMADFNGDGHLDLATSDSVVLGDGAARFFAPQGMAAVTQSNPLVVNAAGDLAVVAQDGDILLRRAIEGQPGQYQAPIVINPGVPAIAIAAVSNGGQPTIIALSPKNDLITLYGVETGSAIATIPLPEGSLPAQIVTGDLNGDALIDLVVRNAGHGTVSVFLGEYGGGYGERRDVLVGVGISSLALADLDGSGRLGLVATNRLTGELRVAPGQGDGTFDSQTRYRAGAGSYALTSGANEVSVIASNDQTAGVAVAATSAGGSSLVAINPGSNTLAVLDTLGVTSLANARAIATTTPARLIRAADLTGSGRDDLTLLGADGVTIYLADGNGGFARSHTYEIGSNATGLTIADVNGDGNADLLVGNTYGDILILVGKGDGSFEPYRKTDQAIALAVAELTGDGQKAFIYANQGLDHVSVQYGEDDPLLLAGKEDGLLAPGAVSLVYFGGNPVPNLVVANSGSNNILVYPGLGNGQFGPALNGGRGYFTGTNPVGITVADLNSDTVPDLVVANQGSNDVSLFYGSGTGADWTLATGPRLQAGQGPVATVVVPNARGSSNSDIVVSDSLANQAIVLPGIGQGFFDDRNPQTLTVGTRPGQIFVGNFTNTPGQRDLITVNAGSNDLTLIPNFEFGGVAQSIPSGGLNPVSAVLVNRGQSDGLVVANRDNGAVALFLAGASGFGISSTASVPNPTSLAVDALTGTVYLASAGRESAVALFLGGASEFASADTTSETSTPTLSVDPLTGIVSNINNGSDSAFTLAVNSIVTGILGSPTSTATQLQLTQFQPLTEGSFLSVVATLTTITVIDDSSDAQSARDSDSGPEDASLEELIEEIVLRLENSELDNDDSGSDEADPETLLTSLDPLSRFLYGLDQAFEQVRLESMESNSPTPAGAGESQLAALAIDTILSQWTPLLAMWNRPLIVVSEAGVRLNQKNGPPAGNTRGDDASHESASAPQEAAPAVKPERISSVTLDPMTPLVAVSIGAIGLDRALRRRRGKHRSEERPEVNA